MTPGSTDSTSMPKSDAYGDRFVYSGRAWATAGLKVGKRSDMRERYLIQPRSAAPNASGTQGDATRDPRARCRAFTMRRSPRRRVACTTVFGIREEEKRGERD